LPVGDPIYMAIQSHEFDVLNEWALLSDDELKGVVSDDSIAFLQGVVSLLSDEKKGNEISVSRNNFVSTVREMRRRYQTGSRLLGQAILEASDWLDKQQRGKAKEVYERFLLSCSSRFYREIAENQLKKLS